MANQLDLFPPTEPEWSKEPDSQTGQTPKQEPPRKMSCPQCGGTAIATHHPDWHNGKTHFCIARCQDFYFTP